ncbi:MAG: DEAD/DEAH box helicase [Bacteroidota bacterium]
MPVTSFEELKLNKQLLSAIEEAGYNQPTDIQQKAIPRILNGHDVMGVAQTGTGKTAAFVLPILMKVKYAQGEDVRALILAPTKELVLQIDTVCRQLASYTDLRVVVLYGGVGSKSQIENLSKGVDIIVATPGRFQELYSKGHIHTKFIKTLVLDEADRMMDMGFMPQIRKILEVIPAKRQNLLFSATMPEKVVRLSEEFLDFPEVIEVTPQATPAKTIEQLFYRVPNIKTKINFLEFLLEDEAFSRVIVFTKTRQAATGVFKYIERKKLGTVNVLHSNKGQNSRIAAMNAFKQGELRILVTTDVSSRGIDVSEVSHVINFDVPVLYEDYVHRIGRTGRAELKGIAITFVNKAEEYHLVKIEKLIKQSIPELQLPKNVEVAKTPFVENQQMEREIDHQKRMENPDYKGAFHEKKRRPSQTKKKNRRRR